MRFEEDFKELLRLFNKHEVKYCIIGAFAMGFHAEPRYTKDLDILVEPTIKNGEKIVKALNEFGFKSLGLSANDFCDTDKFIQLGHEPVRIDLITSIKGLDFERIWKHRVKGNYDDQRVFFIGLAEFIKSKEIANRKQDIADLEKLASIKKKRK